MTEYEMRVIRSLLKEFERGRKIMKMAEDQLRALVEDSARETRLGPAPHREPPK